MKPEDEETREFQAQVNAAMDAVADLAGDATPSVEALTLLAAQVQREQRRTVRRDLALFWGCAMIILALLIGGATRSPALFLGIQAVAVLLLVGGAAFWSAVGRGAP